MADSGSSAADESEERVESATTGDGAEKAVNTDRATRTDEAGRTDEVDLTTEELRERVESEYNFENFGPAEMAEMSQSEWEAVFDEDSWITGDALLDRVEADLKYRVAERDVFARVERFEDLLVAYSDTGYAAVYPDGRIDGEGTVLRDVKPTVALCSMDSYDVPEMPDDDDLLPEPREVPESSDALGNTVLQVIGGVQILAGLVLLAAVVFVAGGLAGGASRRSNLFLLVVAGLGFLVIGIFMFVIVANARLSDKFRAEEYRNRLRAVGLEDGQRPDFLYEIDGIEGELPDRSEATDHRTGSGGGTGTNPGSGSSGNPDVATGSTESQLESGDSTDE